MSELQPRISSAQVTLAILAAIAFLFVGCVQLSTGGRAFELRGGGELSGALCIISGALLAFWLYRIAFKTKPSFVLHHDRVEFYTWRRPVHFDDIEEVVFLPGQFWTRSPPTLALRLNNGSIQHLPYGLMTHGPEGFAHLLNEALQRHRDGTEADPAEAPITPVTTP